MTPGRRPHHWFRRLRHRLIGVEVAQSRLVLLLDGCVRCSARCRARGAPSIRDAVDDLLAISMDAIGMAMRARVWKGSVRAARRHLEATSGSAVDGTGESRSIQRCSLRDRQPARGRAGFPPSDLPRGAIHRDFPDVIDLEVVRGRWFSGTADEEVVINESLLAAALCGRKHRQPVVGGGDPLGQRLTTGESTPQSLISWLESFAMRRTADARHQREPLPVPAGTHGTHHGPHVGTAAAVARSATSAVKQLDARLVVTFGAAGLNGSRQETAPAVEPSSQFVGDSATLALLIALGGVAAIAAPLGGAATREIGIRIALGARRGDAVGLIVRMALAPVAHRRDRRTRDRLRFSTSSCGSSAHASAAAVWHQSAGSGVVHGHGGVSDALAATAAAWLPARRAAGVDPVLALRSE